MKLILAVSAFVLATMVGNPRVATAAAFQVEETTISNVRKALQDR